MQAKETGIKGVFLVEPKVFEDERGYFFESYSHEKLQKHIPQLPTWVQDNESKSKKGVLRGLHFQRPPYAQNKLVRVVRGAVLDVLVDLRKGSPTYGKWEKHLLSAENKRQLLVPDGFAHGFLVLEDDTVFSYKCSAVFNGPSEGSLRWNDPDLAIEWELDKLGIEVPILSEKDQSAALLSRFETPFT